MMKKLLINMWKQDCWNMTEGLIKRKKELIKSTKISNI